jgi:hypothetical protein
MKTLVMTLIVLYVMSLGIVAGRMMQVAYLNWRDGKPMLMWSWQQVSLALLTLLVPFANTVFAVSALRHLLEDE